MPAEFKLSIFATESVKQAYKLTGLTRYPNFSYTIKSLCQ